MDGLLATLLQHEQWAAALRHGCITFITDSQAAAADVQQMRGVGPVYRQVLSLYERAAAHDVDVIIEWRPRGTELLRYADMHSKMVDHGDWGVDRAIFGQVCAAWGLVPQVDWFASPWSAQCPVFYSRFLMHGCAGVDAFDFDWRHGGQFSWICPPHMIVGKVLAKVMADRASCVLVLPAWYHVWCGQLQLLPVAASRELPASCIQWGPRAPQRAQRCTALNAGLRAYLVHFR